MGSTVPQCVPYQYVSGMFKWDRDSAFSCGWILVPIACCRGGRNENALRTACHAISSMVTNAGYRILLLVLSTFPPANLIYGTHRNVVADLLGWDPVIILILSNRLWLSSTWNHWLRRRLRHVRRTVRVQAGTHSIEHFSSFGLAGPNLGWGKFYEGFNEYIGASLLRKHLANLGSSSEKEIP